MKNEKARSETGKLIELIKKQAYVGKSKQARRLLRAGGIRGKFKKVVPKLDAVEG